MFEKLTINIYKTKWANLNWSCKKVQSRLWGLGKTWSRQNLPVTLSISAGKERHRQIKLSYISKIPEKWILQENQAKTGTSRDPIRPFRKRTPNCVGCWCSSAPRSISGLRGTRTFAASSRDSTTTWTSSSRMPRSSEGDHLTGFRFRWTSFNDF